ncbi:MAG TPA: polyisoprenoid-binding protein [Rhodospirillaceae bacterium]|nr:polyisoprenoid-binding protein [Rhodospirillaceae bacterium]
MIRKTLRTVALTAMASTLAFSAQAAEKYTLDASHTAITWHVNHFGFSTPSGKFMGVEGEVILDEANPASSSVKVTVDVNAMNSGVEKLDEHLKNADFFDVAKFPTATFVSKKVVLTGKDTAKVEGELTLHGVTKPITLDVKLNKIGENMRQMKTAGFTASTTIKRSEFGMSTYVPNLGDDIKIDIESEANILPAAEATPATPVAKK